MRVVPILTYHNIGEPPSGVGLPEMYVSVDAFRSQLRWLRRIGCRGVTMTTAMSHLSGARRGRAVALTFDDGYADIMAALPHLCDFGFSATCYVVSARIGMYNTWDDAVLGVRKPLMDLEQLREWCARGMEIGAHTRTHPRLSLCDDSQLDDEIRYGRQELEDTLGITVTQFCYPFGDTGGSMVPQLVRAAGFVAATTTQRGRACDADDPFRLPRIAVKRHKPSHLLPWRVLTSYEDRRR